MIDYVLKFPSEAKSVELAAAAGLIQDGALVRFSAEYGIFVQGVITQTGPLGADLQPLAPPVVLPGWWVRVRILPGENLPEVFLPDAFLPYVTDERPAELWGIV